MIPTRSPARATGDPSWWPGLPLLCAAGFNLRSVLLATPAALPAIQSQFSLSFVETGVLAAIPIVVMGAFALPGAMVVGRAGGRVVVGVAIGCLAIASVLRIAPPEPLSLYVWTAVFAAFISLAQPALAVMSRSWFPNSVQSTTTAYVTSLNVGVVAASSASVYLVARMGWPATFALWSSIALVTSALWFAFAPRVPRQVVATRAIDTALRDRLLIRIAVVLGSQSVVFYSLATWIPFHLRASGSGTVGLVLFLFTAVTVPVGILLASLKASWAWSRSFYVAASGLVVIGSVAVGLVPAFAWAGAICVGIGVAMVFSGGMALPNLMAPTTAHVAAYSAIALTAAHMMGFFGPLVGGALVEWTHSTTSPFVLAAAVGLAIGAIGATLPLTAANREAAVQQAR